MYDDPRGLEPYEDAQREEEGEDEGGDARVRGAYIYLLSRKKMAKRYMKTPLNRDVARVEAEGLGGRVGRHLAVALPERRRGISRLRHARQARDLCLN